MKVYSWLSDKENREMNEAEHPVEFEKLEVALEQIREDRLKKLSTPNKQD